MYAITSETVFWSIRNVKLLISNYAFVSNMSHSGLRFLPYWTTPGTTLSSVVMMEDVCQMCAARNRQIDFRRRLKLTILFPTDAVLVFLLIAYDAVRLEKN